MLVNRSCFFTSLLTFQFVLSVYGQIAIMTGLLLAKALTRENYCTTYDGNPGTCKLRVENCPTLRGVSKSSVRTCVKSGISLPWNPICCPKSARTCEAPPTPRKGNSLRCGKSPRIKAIVGGSVTEKNKYPWMVAILAKTGSSYRLICGGSLISERFILTAAHCVTKTSGKQRASDLRILVGAHDIARDGELYEVSAVYPHEDYKFWLAYHDIALIKLARDVPFDDIINPICLSPATLLKKIKREKLIGYPAVVAGWGTTSYEGAVSSKLREVTVQIYNRTVCNENYARMDGAKAVLPQGITESFVCAGAEGRDSCQGDSGGPLIYYDRTTERYYQIGVVSFGYKCAEPGFPGVYSNIPYYLKWIGCHMEEYHSKD